MKQIIAMGGGGFSMEPDNPLLDLYILEQSLASRPRICFIPTASGDAEEYTKDFYKAFRPLSCRPSHLSLFRPPNEDLRSFVLKQDILYVGGGNTRNLLILWKEWGLDTIIREAWEQGVILAGLSAGSVCWFEEGVTDSFPGKLRALSALGFLPGSHCPHYDGEKERRPAYYRLRMEDALSDGIVADDGAALHYIGTHLHQVVSSRPDATAYLVEKREGGIQETPLESRYLG